MKAMKCLIISLVFVFGVLSVWAQPQEVIWERVVPFSYFLFDANSDGEVVVGGYTNSSTPWPYDSSITFNKYSPDGSLVWSKMLVCDGYWTFMEVSNLIINDLGEVFVNVNSNVQYPTYYYIQFGSPAVELDGGLVKLSSDGSLDWNIPCSLYAKLYKYENLLYITIPNPNGSFNLGGWIPWIGVTGPHYAIVKLHSDGTLVNYKYLRSSDSIGITSVHIQDSYAYFYGGFSGNIVFENTLPDGSIESMQLVDANGNGYLAKLSLSSNDWMWQKNITYSASIISELNDNLYLTHTYSDDIYKHSALSGDFLNCMEGVGCEFLRLFTPIDNKLHFDGIVFPHGYWAYGVVDAQLNFEDFNATNVSNWTYYTSDNIGNRYLGNHNSNSYYKYGFPDPYPVRLEPNPVSFDECYPEVQYERLIPLVNIGNSPLSVTELEFINSTPGLSAEVYSGSPAASGDSLFVRLRLNSSTIGAVSDTLVVQSNSPYEPSITIKVTGNVVAVPPLAPDNVSIAIDGNNVVLNWPAVTQTIFNTPVDPDYYFVFLSDDPSDNFVFHGATEGLQYVQPMVAAFQPRMFYHVVAYKYYGRSDFGLAALGLEPGMTEEEVMRRLEVLK